MTVKLCIFAIWGDMFRVCHMGRVNRTELSTECAFCKEYSRTVLQGCFSDWRRIGRRSRRTAFQPRCDLFGNHGGASRPAAHLPFIHA